MLTLALLFILPLEQDGPKEWINLGLGGYGFTVTMPAPKRQTLDEKGPDDKPLHITIFRGKVGDASYIVTVSEFSKTYMAQPAKVIFDNARNGSLARSGGTLMSEKDIKLGTVEGRETIVKAKEEGFVKAHLYVYNQRQYAVMIGSTKQADLDSEDAKRFFDSFQLKPIKGLAK